MSWPLKTTNSTTYDYSVIWTPEYKEEVRKTELEYQREKTRCEEEEEIYRRIVDYDLTDFDSPDLPGSGKHMNPELIRKLVQMEQILERKVDVRSGYRTKNWNNHLKKRGLKAVSNSAHMHWNATDIVVRSSAERMEILRAAIEVGFKRIGVSNAFVHVDIDESKPQEIIWTY